MRYPYKAVFACSRDILTQSSICRQGQLGTSVRRSYAEAYYVDFGSNFSSPLMPIDEQYFERSHHVAQDLSIVKILSIRARRTARATLPRVTKCSAAQLHYRLRDVASFSFQEHKYTEELQEDGGWLFPLLPDEGLPSWVGACLLC